MDNIEQLKSAGGPYRRVGKGLINSLYGRFALRDIRSRDYIYTEPDNLSDFVEISPGCYVGKKTAYSELSMNIAIAAAISAKARIRLFRAMQAVHAAGGRVLYCDTDSIVAAYAKSPLGTHVGELYYDADNPNTIITDAVFASPKTYAIKYPTMDIIRVKGVKVAGVTYDAFKKAVEDGADLVFKEQVYLSRRGYKLRRGSVDKTIKINNYNKRRFVSKTTTEPLNYDDQG